MTKARMQKLVPALVIALAGLIIGVVLANALGAGEPEAKRMSAGVPEGQRPAIGPTAPTHVQNPGAPDFASIEQRVADDPLALGDVAAPVVMLAFSDYQCPFCALWTDRTLPVMKKYVEAGQLRIEWHDISIFGEDSERAALAALAAGAQGRFWDFHDELFAGGRIRQPQQLSHEELVAVADKLGLDVAKFSVDLAAPETAQTVAKNKALGSDLGVYSTPVFVINGKPIIGAQPEATFTDAVEAALKEAGR
ncbi:thioredoxin domain-containing protein [Trueperella pecoris]|uniref:Thioredoxin domain-containing protein n=1 Tax=Trueperella pecoris TaxID=2733571 RepID=A0A7M1QZ59_9ACTO|nr:thioredoxin domain-containing protein [Trueperella pecoris]QOR47310.1 thioredoxin domain-containing protein [Trueperella pecoris]